MDFLRISHSLVVVSLSIIVTFTDGRCVKHPTVFSWLVNRLELSLQAASSDLHQLQSLIKFYSSPVELSEEKSERER